MITPDDLDVARPNLLEQAIAAAKAGNRPLARLHLEKAVVSEPDNADVWLWLAWTADSPAAVLSALEEAQRNDPGNRLIPSGLAWARGMYEFERCRCEPHDSQASDLDGDNVWLTEAPVETTDPSRRTNYPPPGDSFDQEPLPVAPFETPEPQPPIADNNIEFSDGVLCHDDPSNEQHTSIHQESQDQDKQTRCEGHEPEPTLANDAAPSESLRPTILAVDDSPTIRKLVSMTLTKHGYNVETASDGVNAMEKIAACSPGLILMDIKMPRLDGYQLCKLVKKHAKTRMIPVIMLSGKDGVFDKMRGTMVGCDSYITKPFESAELIRKVSQYIPLAVGTE